MLNKLIITSLFVFGVLSKSSFIGDSRKRAELFELTDNEVAVFRVTLPDDEFAYIKEEVGSMVIPPPPEEGFPPNIDEEGFHPPLPFEKDIKTKNATMIVELNDEKKSFDEVTLSIGGSSSRTFGKQGFNLKVRGKKNLYGRTQFRLRPDAREATFLRSKLTCDIHNRLGLPSISANYATLYINDEYMGFYVLLDAFKLSWVEFEYDDKDTTTLYQCKDMNNQLTVKTSSTGCTNENENVTDHSEWNELLTRLDAAQSAEDIEDIFDVDQFLTEIAFEYLSGSWDHYLNFGHNFYMYKPKDDKWKFFLYDFDAEFGQDVSLSVAGAPFDNTPLKTNSTDFPTYTFEEWTKERHLIDILILKDSTRFDNILRDFVKKAFNPTVLFPHIDELKEFIRPYVELDKTPDENGKYPGRINEKANDYSLREWEANSEFTRVGSSQGSGHSGQSYGLKYWILAKYRYVCKAYKIDDCDPKYLDENYEIPIDKEVEPDEEMSLERPLPPLHLNGDEPQINNTVIEPSVVPTAVEPSVIPTTTLEPQVTSTVIEQPNTTTAVDSPNATTTVDSPDATTTVDSPDATTIVDSPDATTAVDSPDATTKKSNTSTKRRCIVKKTSTKKLKTNFKKFKNTKKFKHHSNKHHSNKHHSNKHH